MANGLCPSCKAVIPSSSERCPSCSAELKISMIPKEKRVEKSRVGAIFGWQIALSILSVIQIVWFFFLGGIPSLIIGIGLFVAVCLMERPINRRWLARCMENDYRKEHRRQARYGETSAEKTPYRPTAPTYTATAKPTATYDAPAARSATAYVPPSGSDGPGNRVDYEVLVKTLREYKALLDSGVLTQEEFDSIKRKLLSEAMVRNAAVPRD